MVRRFEAYVPKPISRSINVKYCSAGAMGMANVRAIRYSGQRSKSQRDRHNISIVMPSLLCMSPLEGSSRRIRFTMIFSSRTVNQPWGRKRVAVCVGDGTIWNIAHIPMTKVKRPSTRNSLVWESACKRLKWSGNADDATTHHLHPSTPPPNSCKWRRPNARSGEAIAVTRFESQNSARRKGSSFPVKK